MSFGSEPAPRSLCDLKQVIFSSLDLSLPIFVIRWVMAAGRSHGLWPSSVIAALS